MKKLYLAISLLLSIQLNAQSIIYVNANATGANNGSSWSDAYIDLNDATNSATSGTHIYVAQGTYYPGVNGTLSYPAYILEPDVSLFGGFPNTGNPTLNDRDWAANPTILDGDIAGDDDGTPATRTDNARRILITNTQYLLDGFTLQNGGDNANAPGAGIAMGGASERNGAVKNCTFKNNWVLVNGGPASEGGAIRASAVSDTDSLIVDNCSFINNVAMQGGAVIFNGKAKITNSRFIKNISGRGSAIFAYVPGNGTSNTNSEISNSVFYKNHVVEAGLGSPNSGGTILRWQGREGYLTINNCTFKENNSSQTNYAHRANIYTNYELTEHTETYFNNCLFDVIPDRNFKSPNNSDLFFNNCIYNGDATFFDVSNSILNSATAFGNITYMLEDTVSGTFILDCASDGVDVGDNIYISNYSEDADGNPRLSGTSVDAGAFETQQTINTTTTLNGNTIQVDQTAISYQWLSCNVSNGTYTVISSATAQSFTATSTGSYACAIDYGCMQDTTACQSITVVGINELSENRINIYPNPTKDVLNIESDLNIRSICITNLMGKIVFQTNLPNLAILDLSSYPKGSYIIHLETPARSYNKQIILQ